LAALLITFPKFSSPFSELFFCLFFCLFILAFLLRDSIYSILGTLINYGILVALGPKAGPLSFAFSMGLLWSFQMTIFFSFHPQKKRKNQLETFFSFRHK
jgi:hypothetical protein